MTLEHKYYINDYKSISKPCPSCSNWHTRCYNPTQRINVHEVGGTMEEGSRILNEI